ncbi:MAG: PEP-CTERM sorting domain-containing protein [Rubrivivax sp.]|nr:PEP-CTERM sorting domain-containing protein [Rubrivivax sp.]
MTHPRCFSRLVTTGLLVAMLASTDAGAALCTGFVQTSFDGPFGGTTDAPMTYRAASGQETAIAITSGDTGGSGFVRATSFSELAYASATVDYTMRLVGPSSSKVPVHVLASGYADGTKYYNASAGITMTQGTRVVAALGVGSPRSTPITATGRFHFTLDQGLMLGPNVDYRVYLVATASSGSRGAGLASFAEAFIDPVFTIAPAFASIYTLTGVPAVPEPAAWVLMLAGATMIGGFTRRQRRHGPAMQSAAIQHRGR